MNKQTFLSYFISILLGLFFPFNTKTSQPNDPFLTGVFLSGAAAIASIIVANQIFNTTNDIPQPIVSLMHDEWHHTLQDFKIKFSTDLLKETPIDELKWSNTIDKKLDDLIYVKFNLT